MAQRDVASLPVMTRAEVARYNGTDPKKPLLLIVDDLVLDVSDFKHPAGQQVLRDYAGKDVTELFYSLHRKKVLDDRVNILKYARLGASESAATGPSELPALSQFPFAEKDMDTSPYFNESHRKLRLRCRRFIQESGWQDWLERNESEGAPPPKDLLLRLGRAGVFGMALGPGDHLNLIPEPNLWSECGIKPSEMDAYHCITLGEETSRLVCDGAADGILAGQGISLGPILHFGQSSSMKQLGQDALLGRASLCLGITEPSGGTDVAGVQTRAKRVDGGYIVNGFKKFITAVCHADYCVALVRLEHDPSKMCVLAIPLINVKGVSTRKLSLNYSASAGTGLLVLENVFVPYANLLGHEGDGFKIIMHNFNGERLMICSNLVSQCRRVVEDAFIWTRQRKAFGKALSDMPVVRLRLGGMLADLQLIEAAQERLLHQYYALPRGERDQRFGGPTALLKYNITRATGRICDQAMNLMGGRSLEKSGLAIRVNRLFTCYKYLSIGGGTEDAMVDLAVKHQLKAADASGSPRARL